MYFKFDVNLFTVSPTKDWMLATGAIAAFTAVTFKDSEHAH